MNKHIATINHLELDAQLRELAKKGDEIEADLIEHLATFIERRLHTAFGLNSAYSYVTTVLGFSRDVAQKRIRAARAALKHPKALFSLRRGDLTVSSLAALSPAIEVPGMFEKALGKSKRDVEKMVALAVGEPSGRFLAPKDGDDVSVVLDRVLVEKLSLAAKLIRENYDLEGPGPSQSDVIGFAIDHVIDALGLVDAPNAEELTDSSEAGPPVPLDRAQHGVDRSVSCEPPINGWESSAPKHPGEISNPVDVTIPSRESRGFLAVVRKLFRAPRGAPDRLQSERKPSATYAQSPTSTNAGEGGLRGDD